MCRIAGIVNKNFQPEAILSAVQEMCNALQHGGPDDEGFFVSKEDSVVFGNRRLALQDLSMNGHQPMHYKDRYTITYNGELYNFPDLKKELVSLGHTFQNQTDTEVVLAAFAQWDTHAFARFNGMYAFALYDALKRCVYLVRDAAGIKPVYYSTSSGGLSFASEVRAMKKLPDLPEASANWPIYLLAYGHIPEPITTMKHIVPLHKGCFLAYNCVSGKSSLQSYAHYSYSSTVKNKNESLGKIDDLLQASVRRQLISDAPLGVFLSGGVDSSIITTIAAKYQGTNLHTISLDFREEAFSEKKYQDILTEQISCTKSQHVLTENEFHASFPSILDAMDMPGCDGINTWFISKLARNKGLKAVLSGVGGDELFGGYPSFARMKKVALLKKLPGDILNSTKNSERAAMRRLPYLRIEGMVGTYLFLRGHYTPNEIARQLNVDEREVWNVLQDLPVINKIKTNAGDKAAWMEFNMYMQNQLLRDADVMGMAHGVEIRVPFLDDEFIRFVNKVDPTIKYAVPGTKTLLIDAFRKRIPREIYERPKMGFTFPFASWLKKSDYAENLLTNGNAYTKSSYTRFKEGRLHWSHLMSLIILRKNGLC